MPTEDRMSYLVHSLVLLANGYVKVGLSSNYIDTEGKVDHQEVLIWLETAKDLYIGKSVRLCLQGL